MHLWWDPSPEPAEEVSVVLEVVDPPTVPHLYFWALQASFVDRGRQLGGAHLGLQWYPPHPGSTAVNWGGYRGGGGELDGDRSTLPSATGNPNTRDFVWRPRTSYRLTIAADGTGSVTDVAAGETTVVRRLLHGGSEHTRLTSPVVWSEVFARCDDPTVTVRWSQLAPTPSALRVSYQSTGEGGCSNTTAEVDVDGAVLQHTNADRKVPAGTRLHL